MKYITAIPVFNRVYSYGIREGQFLLTNIEKREDYVWGTLPVDVNTIEEYTPLVAGARNRLFLVSDESGANKWIAVQTRLQCLLVDAPWRDVMKHLRVNIDDLGNGDYYIKHMANNYHMGLGNFYLYPELNPLNLPLIKRPEALTIEKMLESINEVFNLQEVQDEIPFGKLTRYQRGMLVSGPHLWWIDRRTKLAYYLNEYFFEGAISLKAWREQEDPDMGICKLPCERDGIWESPKLTAASIAGLLESAEMIPATGTRITPHTKADKTTSGEYTISGYGRFGRVEMTDRQIANIRLKLGTCLGLEIRGERFIGIYNISDIRALYIREKANWVEPVVKSPMVDTPEIEVVENSTEAADFTPLAPLYRQGWQSPNSNQSLMIEPTPAPEEPVDAVVEQVVEAEPEIEPIQEQPLPVLEVPADVEVKPIEVGLSVDISKAEETDTADDFNSQVDNDVVVSILGDVPVIYKCHIGNHVDLVPRPMLQGKVVLIDIGGCYGDLIPWKKAKKDVENKVQGIIPGELFSTAKRTLLCLNSGLYVADMHVNLQ